MCMVYDINLGFQITTSCENEAVLRASVVLFADDMILLAESAVELQQMLYVCGEKSNEIGKSFNESM